MNQVWVITILQFNKHYIMQHEHCPYCGQRTFVYARTLRYNQVICLRILNKSPLKFEGLKAIEISSHKNLISDFSKMRHWGLIDYGTRKNTWKITERGIAFLRGKISVIKYVFIFNNELQEQPDDSDLKQEMLYWWDISKKNSYRNIWKFIVENIESTNEKIMN